MGIDFCLVQVPWYSCVLIIGGTLGLVMLGVGRFFSYYDITYIGSFEVEVKFSLPKYRKFLLLGIPPKLGSIKPQVVYEYNGDKTRPCDAKWEGETGIWTTVNGEGLRVLHTWQWDNREPAPLDNSKARLPDKFKLVISLIRQSGNKLVGKPYKVLVEID